MTNSAAPFDGSLVLRRFEAGEEAEARALVSAPPRVPPLVITKFQQNYEPLASGLVALLPVLVALVVWALTASEYPGLGLVVLGSATVLGAVVSVVSVVTRRFSDGPKHISIDGHSGDVMLDETKVASLSEFFVPRVIEGTFVSLRSEYSDYERRMHVYAERVDAEPFRLFPWPVAHKLQFQITQIADHLNALILEHNYRREVRRWLEERAGQQTPYRRPEAGS